MYSANFSKASGQVKRALVLLGCLVLPLLFGACSSGRDKASEAVQGEKDIITPAEFSFTDEIRQLSHQALKLPEADVNLQYTGTCCGTLLLSGTDGEKERHFYTLSGEKSEVMEISGFEGEGTERLAVSPGGALHVLNTDSEGSYVISTRSPEGQFSQIRPELGDLGGMATGFYADDRGYYMEIDGQLLAFDLGGKLVENYGQFRGSRTVVALESKTLLISMDSAQLSAEPGKTARGTVCVLEEDFSRGQSYAVQPMFVSFFSAPGDRLLAYMENTVYEYNYETGESRALVDTLSSNISMDSFACLGDELYFGLIMGQGYILRPAEPGSTRTLTLAGYDISYGLQDAVAAVNMSSPSYRVELRDYAQYDTYDSADKGFDLLVNDVITGKVPDIFDLKGFAPNNLAAKGLLEDLKPWFEADSLYRYEELLPCVRETMEFRGGLYELAPSFSVYTMVADKTTVEEGWNMERLAQMLEDWDSVQLLGPKMTRDTFLEYALCFAGEELYSAQNKSCNFNSPEFKAILELAASMPEEPSGAAVSMGLTYTGEQKIAMWDFGRYTVDEIALFNCCFSGQAQFIGFPTWEGASSGLLPGERLAMSSAGKDKAGVWEFFRFLLENRDFMDGLPSVWPVFDESIEAQLARAIKNPPAAQCSAADGALVTIRSEPIDSEYVSRQVEVLTEKVECLAICDEQILDIVLNCAQGYFQKDKDVDSVAKEIQSRVGIYLAEQYG